MSSIPLAELRRKSPLYAYRTAAYVASRLPKQMTDRVATVLGRVLSRAMASRRDIVIRHQLRITPALRTDGDKALEQRLSATFDSYARYWVSMFRLQSFSQQTIDDTIVVDGAHHIDDALAKGYGAIMAMPHVGAWDHGGAWLAGHWPLTVVAERVEPPELFDWFCAQRKRNGMTVVPLDDNASAPLLAALRRNEVLGLLCDRDIAGGGVDVEFFGETTTLPAGPAMFALRTGAAILPNAVYQRADGTAHGVIRPPLDFTKSGSLRNDIKTVTQLLATELEDLIRAAPHQWHVLQPNWPSDRGLPSGSDFPSASASLSGSASLSASASPSDSDFPSGSDFPSDRC